MTNPLPIAKNKEEIYIVPKMGNRHGLITGATGTGKTVTLQVMAENFSKIGVPSFVADVKGDFAGISQPGGGNPKVEDRIKSLGLENFKYSGFPVTFWDVFGKDGHPARTTISEMGPLLLARLLNLNEVQSGVLTATFEIADDNGMLLMDLKDLRSMIAFVGENASDYTTKYGNISTASVGAIQRSLLALEQQGADKLFGEPALNLYDLMQTQDGLGMINILAADKLMHSPKVYSTFLLFLLSELFEELPEVGDLEKPKLVFFFDEAHLLFNDAPPALLEKIEHVVRLVRSKGVGIYFITQNPLDIPDIVLGQLGNRIQHALRAFTPRDQKAVKAAATTFRQNPEMNTEETITQLGVGEALVSFLDEKGSPSIVQRAWIIPPHSRVGTVTPDERTEIIRHSNLYGHYEKQVDRESAYEMLMEKAEQKELDEKQEEAAKEKLKAEKNRKPEFWESVAKSAARSATTAIAGSLGRAIMRGVLGSITGTTKSRRR